MGRQGENHGKSMKVPNTLGIYGSVLWENHGHNRGSIAMLGHNRRYLAHFGEKIRILLPECWSVGSSKLSTEAYKSPVKIHMFVPAL